MKAITPVIALVMLMLKIYNKAAGGVSIQPGADGIAVNCPGTAGRHTARIGTSSNIVEATITCS